MKKITHFPQKCIGCLACVSIAPELFAPDQSNGLSCLLQGQPEGEGLTCTLEDEQVPELLVETCPAQAITLEIK